MTRRRTRVLVVNDSLNVGGAERVSVDIANTLDRDRFEVAFCCTRAGGPLQEQLKPDVPQTVLHRAATWDVRKLAPFRRLVRSGGFDIVHSHGRGTMKFVALARASLRLPIRHVFHDHFGLLHQDRGVSAGLGLAMRTEVDAYIGVDQRLCTWAIRHVGLPPDRVHLLRNGVDLSRFSHIEPVDLRTEFAIPPDRTIVVAAASFRLEKDFPTLFLAMAELPEELRDRMHLVICGSTDADPDYHRQCMDMVDRLHLTDRVHVAGTRDDLPAVLAGADAGVLSSKNETGPLVVLEYMASGLPFVATDTGEVTQAVRNLDVGFIPAPRDHHELADALSSLLRMTPEERRTMGARGSAEARSRFAQELVTRQIEGIYDEVLDRAPRRPTGDPLGRPTRPG